MVKKNFILTIFLFSLIFCYGQQSIIEVNGGKLIEVNRGKGLIVIDHVNKKISLSGSVTIQNIIDEVNKISLVNCDYYVIEPEFPSLLKDESPHFEKIVEPRLTYIALYGRWTYKNLVETLNKGAYRKSDHLLWTWPLQKIKYSPTNE